MKRAWVLAATFLMVALLATGCSNQANEATNVGGLEAPADGYPGAGAVNDTTGSDAGAAEAPAEGYAEPEGSEAETPTDEPADEAGSDSGAAGIEGKTVVFVMVKDSSEASYSVGEEFFEGATERLGIDPGLVDTVGVTQDVGGQFTIDLSEAPALVSGDFTADISKLSSNQERRDERIREQWLESSLYPQATFTATGIEGVPDNYADGEPFTFQLLGDLTIREVTQPATFEVTATLEGDALSGTATTNILMTDYGFDPPSFMGMFDVANEVLVTVTFVATQE